MLLALHRPAEALGLDVAAALSTLVALIGFSAQPHQNLSVLFAWLAAAYVPPLALWVGWLRPGYVTPRQLRFYGARHVGQGKWLLLTALTQWWAGHLFVVAAGFYLGAAALGALRLAQSLMGVLNVLLQAFENYLLPQKAFRLQANAPDALAYLSRTSRQAGYLFVGVLLLCFVFAPYLMGLVGGGAFVPYAFVLQGMTLLYVLVFLSQPVRILIRARLLNQHFFYGYLGSLVFALLFSRALLAGLGLVGVLIGLAVSQSLLIVYWTLILKSKKIELWKSFISY